MKLLTMKLITTKLRAFAAFLIALLSLTFIVATGNMAAGQQDTGGAEQRERSTTAAPGEADSANAQQAVRPDTDCIDLPDAENSADPESAEGQGTRSQFNAQERARETQSAQSSANPNIRIPANRDDCTDLRRPGPEAED